MDTLTREPATAALTALELAALDSFRPHIDAAIAAYQRGSTTSRSAAFDAAATILRPLFRLNPEDAGLIALLLIEDAVRGADAPPGGPTEFADMITYAGRTR